MSFGLRGVLALLTVLVMFVVASCDTSEAEGTVVSVGPTEAVRLIAEGEAIVVDLRSPRAFAAAHVAGAVNVDASAADFEERVARLDEGATYLVYARTAELSAPAADKMVRLGIERVVDAGGFGLLAIAGAGLEG